VKKMKKALSKKPKEIKELAKYLSGHKLTFEIKKNSITIRNESGDWLLGFTGKIDAKNMKVVEECKGCNSEARIKEKEELQKSKTNLLDEVCKLKTDLQTQQKDLESREKKVKEREKEIQDSLHTLCKKE